MNLTTNLEGLRVELQKGDNTNQARLNSICEDLIQLRELLRPLESMEIIQIVNSDGSPKDLLAPRWLCHLLGLRHKCSHVIVSWKSPSLGKVFILQVRNWTKPNSPGHIDISVGGHVKVEDSAEDTA